MAALVHLWAESPSGHHPPLFLFGLALCIRRLRCTSNPQFLNPTPSWCEGHSFRSLENLILYSWAVVILCTLLVWWEAGRGKMTDNCSVSLWTDGAWGQEWREFHTVWVRLRRPLFFIDVQLIYNVLLISGVQQADSLICIYLFSFGFFSIVGYYEILNIVSCSI